MTRPVISLELAQELGLVPSARDYAQEQMAGLRSLRHANEEHFEKMYAEADRDIKSLYCKDDSLTVDRFTESEILAAVDRTTRHD